MPKFTALGRIYQKAHTSECYSDAVGSTRQLISDANATKKKKCWTRWLLGNFRGIIANRRCQCGVLTKKGIKVATGAEKPALTPHH